MNNVETSASHSLSGRDLILRTNMTNNTDTLDQDSIVFEINNEDVFDTALATCQHSITGGGL